VPEPVAALPSEPVPDFEPEPGAPAFETEDLDTPAYLRQGRLLN
jgi:hypothetical protein